MDYRHRLTLRTLSVLQEMDRRENTRIGDPTTPQGELDIICDLLVKHKCKRVLELGTYIGHTSIVMADICGSVVTVDKSSGETVEYFANRAAVDVKYLQGLSTDTHIVLSMLAYKFDAVFLDTNHDYESTKKEIEIYAFMSPMMILHDCSVNESKYDLSEQGGVRKAFYEWLANNLYYRGTIYESPEYPDALHGVGVLWRPY